MTRFTLYPAIDLMDGACIRLTHGAMEQATIDAAGRTGLTNVVPYRTHATKI